jgi:hypothetical protein
MSDVDVSFILVKTPQLPEPAAIIASAGELGVTITAGVESSDDILSFAMPGKRSVLVALMRAPHPDAPNMLGGPTSPSPETVAQSRAHIIVTALGLDGDAWTRDTQMMLLTAAVIANVDAIGAMLGLGIAIHGADVFAKVAQFCAREHELVPPELAIELTAARESDTRMSFLTHGMVRYGREEFLVTCPINGKGAREFVLMMARWMLTDRGKQLPTGETVGRTEDEKLRIQRVPNPTGEGPEVIRLDLP